METAPGHPVVTVDAIIEVEGGIVLIQRKNPPHGWAIPGGFVDYGETLENAVVREMKEETGLDINITRQFHTYSAPDRDPRRHTITTVFIATASGTPVAGDDAEDAGVFTRETLPYDMAFDHREILEDYFNRKY
jgi:ADP-ribose pyrophosphatase YjhB (NUDIX family)